MTNGEVFYSFIEECLLPKLMPFDGFNPHSVVVMDCFIHHISEIVQMIEEVGTIVHFLPPYPPDLMPIEIAFSKVKKSLKQDGIEEMADMEIALTFAIIIYIYKAEKLSVRLSVCPSRR